MNTSTEKVPEEDRAYRQLIDLLRAGDYAGLETAASEFVARHDSHGAGWHLVGFSRLNLGNALQSRPALERAAALLEGDAEVWDHLGIACNLLGDWGAASAAFSKSLALAPDRAETWVNAGKNMRDMGSHEKAIDAYEHAVGICPDLVEAHSNLSVEFDELGLSDRALQAADRAIEIAPGLAIAHVHRGNALKNSGRINDALHAYDRALVLDDKLSLGWNNLADALYKAGDKDNALIAAERARKLAPDDPNVLNTLATLYADSSRRDEAEFILRQVIRLDSDSAAAWLNLGFISDELPVRIGCFEQALRIRPDSDRALSALLFAENYAGNKTPGELLALARRYGALVDQRTRRYETWNNSIERDRPLRVGIVSPDLCDHPVAYFLEAPLMAGQEKEIEWYAYSCAERNDETTARLKKLFACWRDVRLLPDGALCEQVRNDQIDILIDLAGHTAGNRLPVFARKPAPVQVTWLGYSGTTGVSGIDYILGDPHIFPAGLPSDVTEAPWLLPETFLSFSAPPLNLECGSPPMVGNRYPTFGCFNNLLKVNDRVLGLWSRVLAEIPDAKLLLRAKQLSSERGKNAFMERLRRAKIDPDRVELGGSLASRSDLLREYLRVDIALDPFPYNGTTTTCEALWMGVPVLTLKGDRLIARVGESICSNVGMRDWVAINEDDFVQCARRFSRDPELLGRLRRTLRTRGSATPLGNPNWFANQMVLALRAMWRAWCASQRAQQ